MEENLFTKFFIGQNLVSISNINYDTFYREFLFGLYFTSLYNCPISLVSLLLRSQSLWYRIWKRDQKWSEYEKLFKKDSRSK